MARLVLISLLVALAFASASAQDLETMAEQAQRAGFQDFHLQFDNPATPIPGNGKLTPQMLAQVPFLATLPHGGVSQAFVTLNACAINQPHVHPRGTEVAYVTKGKITMGFVEENGGRQNLTFMAQAGQSFVFPQGLMHYAINQNCEPAAFIATFPNDDPGTQTMASNLFALPNFVLAATFPGLDAATLANVAKVAIGATNPSADPACLAKCAGQGTGTGTTTITPTATTTTTMDPHMMTTTTTPPPVMQPQQPTHVFHYG